MGRKEQIDMTAEEDRTALVGSSFDSFLEEEGIKDEVEAGARKAVAEFEQEVSVEDAEVAKSKVNDCGHPLTAVVSRGKGEGATSFCAICEAEARAMSVAGVQCVVCKEEIEGSHYHCSNYGGDDVCLKCHSKMSRHLCVYLKDDLPTEGLAHSYDQYTDILTIEGTKYAGALFRSLSFAPIGAVLRVVNRQDGVITVEEEPK